MLTCAQCAVARRRRLRIFRLKVYTDQFRWSLYSPTTEFALSKDMHSKQCMNKLRYCIHNLTLQKRDADNKPRTLPSRQSAKSEPLDNRYGDRGDLHQLTVFGGTKIGLSLTDRAGVPKKNFFLGGGTQPDVSQSLKPQ